MKQKKTKIVATIGPASNSKRTIEELVDAGVDVFRFNFSHSDHETHEEVFDRVREVSDDIALMLDTKGPEVRLREVEESTELQGGETVEITSEKVIGNSRKLSINHVGIENRLEEGDRILIDDGKVALKVKAIGENIECLVQNGGEIGSRKSVNVPGKDVGLSAPTEKDLKDLKFGAEKGFDFVALSFVKEASDVEEVRQFLEEHDADIDIISKIEHLKAVENYSEILEASDGVMVARGDLGVEARPARVPLLQKEQIREANRASKPVITATQMLESMTENPMATRAEASDVANAVIDGTDAVMLSGESAVGDYPVKAVEFMKNIVKEVEKSNGDDIHHTVKQRSKTVTDVISKSVWQSSKDLDTDLIVAHTSSGSTAKNIARYRPNQSIIAFTDKKEVKRKLNLVWGVKPIYIEFSGSVDDLIYRSAKTLYDRGIVEEDNQIVLSSGVPTAVPGATNMMEIRNVEDILEHKS